jgi:ubiquinone/menaquinone biosynthesis C-methylase UbiE
MSYLNAYSENIPSPDGYFDYVFSFNSMDHVDNVAETMTEINRTLKINGNFLLIVEINHAPRICEPQALTKEFVDFIEKHTQLKCSNRELYGIKYTNNGYRNVKEKIPVFDNSQMLLARFIKN